MNIRSAGVQYMKNNPERFIESSTDHSWLRCLVYISHQGTQVDALVIQAVAYALNLTIHIIESNPGFASVTTIGTVRSETDTTVINIGHLDEIHYVQVNLGLVSMVNFYLMAFVCNRLQDSIDTTCTI